MKKFLNEFKEFAMKGNVLDMAIGIVIGSAFTSIVSSLVADIITPFISLLTGNVNFTNLQVVLNEETGLVLTYGNFLQSIIDFILVAFCLFLVVKAMNKFKKKQEEAPAPAPAVDEKVELLKEIRDLLKEEKEA